MRLYGFFLPYLLINLLFFVSLPPPPLPPPPRIPDCGRLRRRPADLPGQMRPVHPARGGGVGDVGLRRRRRRRRRRQRGSRRRVCAGALLPRHLQERRRRRRIPHEDQVRGSRQKAHLKMEADDLHTQKCHIFALKKPYLLFWHALSASPGDLNFVFSEARCSVKLLPKVEAEAGSIFLCGKKCLHFISSFSKVPPFSSPFVPINVYILNKLSLSSPFPLSPQFNNFPCFLLSVGKGDSPEKYSSFSLIFPSHREGEREKYIFPSLLLSASMTKPFFPIISFFLIRFFALLPP